MNTQPHGQSGARTPCRTWLWAVVPLVFGWAMAGCGDNTDSSPPDDAGNSSNTTADTAASTGGTSTDADDSQDTPSDTPGDVATSDTPQDADPDVAQDADIPGDAATDTAPDALTDTTRDTTIDPPDAVPDTAPPVPPNPDLNGDGTLNILVLGTTRSIQRGGEAFAPEPIAAELRNILMADTTITTGVNVVAEDIYQTAQVTLGLGQGGMEFTWPYSSHSLTQYYHWPDGLDARMDRLSGQGDVVWDQVVVGADPYIVATTPGYYALGVHTIAAKVAEGGAQPLLLMTWPRDTATLDHVAEHTYRTADGSPVPLPTIPAGRAWADLAAEQRDTSATHPTPNGAYLAAAAIYAHLYDRSATTSDYTINDALADAAYATLLSEADAVHYTGPRTFVSPFIGAHIPDRILNYNHTGTSSERGILAGLRWVLERARVPLQNGGDAPIDFNFGRANTNFEPDKRYQLDPTRFDISLGFPMQDNGNHGDTSMLYGLDRRINDSENGTDLGVALYMVRQGELPTARAVPIRTLYARIKEVTPTQSAYRDAWHMHRDLDKASAAFMYTLLTGHCALDDEPEEVDSNAWRQWMAHKIGYETAWNLMHLSGVAPGFKVLPEEANRTQITPTEGANLLISFVNPPNHDVTVTLSTDIDGAITPMPDTLVFTPENHSVPQTVTLTGVAGGPSIDAVIVTSTTTSADRHFDGLTDRWAYPVVR